MLFERVGFGRFEQAQGVGRRQLTDLIADAS